MLQGLLSSDVVVVSYAGDDVEAELFAGEAGQIAGAVEARRREFATARSCARQALAKLGYGMTAILRGSSGEPLWPTGAVGSITHCQGYRAAAVAHAATVKAVGIDAETHSALHPDVRSLVLRPEEQLRVSSQATGIHSDLLVFAAKECVFKVWFPLANTWLGHEGASVSLDCKGGSFRVDILDQVDLARELGLSVLHGRYAISNGLLLAAITVTPEGSIRAFEANSE